MEIKRQLGQLFTMRNAGFAHETVSQAYEDFCVFCETSTKIKIIAGETPTSLGTTNWTPYFRNLK